MRSKTLELQNGWKLRLEEQVIKLDQPYEHFAYGRYQVLILDKDGNVLTGADELLIQEFGGFR